MQDLEQAIRERAITGGSPTVVATGMRTLIAECTARSPGNIAWNFARVTVEDTQVAMNVKKRPARKSATKGKRRAA